MNPREPISIAERQRQLVADYLLIENKRERLAAIIDRARKLPPLPPEERIEKNRILVCQSMVWLVGEFKNGTLSLRYDADSVLVRGLVGLLCEIYQDGTAEEILSVEPTLFDELGIAPELSPTRKNGLAGVRRRIVELARNA